MTVEGQTTGAVTYWHLSGAADAATLRAAWVAAGLNEALLPGSPSPHVALSRAVKAQGNKKRECYRHPEGGWVLVDVRHVRDMDGKLTINFALGLRVRLGSDVDGKPTLVANKPKDFDPVEAANLMISIRAAYDRAQAEIASVDISTWLVYLASQVLKGVALRETGGLYFIPRAKVAVLKQVQEALRVATSNVVYLIPAMHSEDAMTAIIDAIRRESQELISTIESEIAAGTFGPRGIKGRIHEIDATKEKLASYGEFLGKKFTSIQASLDVLKVKVSAVTARASLLEVD